MTTNKYTKIFNSPLFYICLLISAFIIYFEIIAPLYKSYHPEENCLVEEVTLYEALQKLNIIDNQHNECA